MTSRTEQASTTATPPPSGDARFCDSHVHVVGDPATHGQAPSRTYTAGPAPLHTLQRIAAPLGVSRFVIVQPSFYGTDNTVLLETLDALAGQGRGVAVLDPAAALATDMAALDRRGVRGLRINLYSGPGRPLEEAFAAVSALAGEQDWHVEVIAPIAMLADNATVLARAPVPVVIDHYGLHGDAAPDGLHGRALLGLLRLPHVWIKLSAPYRVVADPLAVRPHAAWLAAILACCAERCVWGSDWPHTPDHALQTGAGNVVPYRLLDYGAVLGGFRSALPDGFAAERILRDNPARLYGFPQ